MPGTRPIDPSRTLPVRIGVVNSGLGTQDPLTRASQVNSNTVDTYRKPSRMRPASNFASRFREKIQIGGHVVRTGDSVLRLVLGESHRQRAWADEHIVRCRNHSQSQTNARIRSPRN
jgi:hypothetical protein